MENFIKSIFEHLLAKLLAIYIFCLFDKNLVDHLAQETNIKFESAFGHCFLHFREIILQVIFDS